MPRSFAKVSIHFCIAALIALGALSSFAATQQTPAPVPAQTQTSPPVTGREIFATSGCTHCHGDAGLGTDKGPSLRTLRKHMNAEQVHHQIHDGGQSMPPFGDALTEEQIAKLVTFLRSKAPWPAQPK